MPLASSHQPSRGLTARLDLMTLRLFVSVIENGGIARAAQAEHIAVSAVSKRLQDLESALRTPLLLRQRQGVLPTPAGDVLLRHARQLLRGVAELEHELGNFAEGARGSVRLLVSESALMDFFPGVIKDFSDRYPHVFIDLVGGLSPSIQRAVVEGAADIGVFLGPVTEQGLDVHPCRFRDLLVLVVAQQHPLAEKESVNLGELAHHTIIGQETNSFVEQLLQTEARKLGLALQSRIKVTGFEAVCNMASAGLGVGVVPLGYARRFEKILALRIVELYEPWATREYKICTKHKSQQSKAMELLVTHLG